MSQELIMNRPNNPRPPPEGGAARRLSRLPDVARRIFLHVATTKTGTTFLQKVMWSHRDRLLEQGVLLPGTGLRDHFRAAIDVREQPHLIRDPGAASGAWARLASEMVAWHGDAVVSHELFAPATADQTRRATGLLGDAEVHVVVTARDLVRQIPAEWQEHLKQRSVLTFPEFLRDLRADQEQGPYSPNGYWFWPMQDLCGVVRRWAAAVPVQRVHVVTVPPAGTPSGLLWERFSGLIGVDGKDFDLAKARANPSVGAEQAELLRRLNSVLRERLPLPGPYPAVVKNLLAHRILAGRDGTRFGLTGEDRAFAVERSRTMAAGLRELGVDVVGDLDELVPGADPQDVSGSTQVPAEKVLDEAVEALAAVLDQLTEERARRRGLQAEVTQARARVRALERGMDADTTAGRTGTGRRRLLRRR
jgi:hypothetical protein